MSFHTPRIDDVEGQSDALGLRSMGISHASIACMRVTLKKPRLTAEMPALVTYRINRFSLPFPIMLASGYLPYLWRSIFRSRALWRGQQEHRCAGPCAERGTKP